MLEGLGGHWGLKG